MGNFGTRKKSGFGGWRNAMRRIGASALVTGLALGTLSATPTPAYAFGALNTGTDVALSETAGTCTMRVDYDRTGSSSTLYVVIVNGTSTFGPGAVTRYQLSTNFNTRSAGNQFNSSVLTACGLTGVNISINEANGTDYTSATNYELKFTGTENGTPYEWHGRIYSANAGAVPQGFLTKTDQSPPDNTAPTLSLSLAPDTIGNDATPRVIISTDEAGTVTYGGSCSSTVNAVAVGPSAITFNTLADGNYTDCSITVTDNSANASTPLAIPAFTIDTTPASMAGAATRAVPNTVYTDRNDIVFRVRLNEPVSGVTKDTFVAVPNSVDVLAAQREVDGTRWLITIAGTPFGSYEGSVSLAVGDDSTVTDAAGNTGFTFTSSESFIVDRTDPSATVTGPALATGDFTVSLAFNEPVTGFDASADLSITNGSTNHANWTQNGNTWSGPVTPSGTPVEVQLGANTVNDAAGKSNAASNILLVAFDATAPVISLASGATSIGNDTTPAIIVTSDEAGTITYGGSCSSAKTNATVGQNDIEFNALAEGTYADCTVQVTDAPGNASNVLAVGSFTIDTTAPSLTVGIASNNANPALAKSGDTITLTIGSDEDLAATPTVTIAGKAATTFPVGDMSNFTATVTVDNTAADGAVGINISGVHDRAANFADAVTAVTDASSVTVDLNAPKMVGNATRNIPNTQDTNADTLVFRVTFDDVITGADTTSFNVFGGSTASVTQVVPVAGGTALDVTVSGGDLASFNGTVILTPGDLNTITDSTGNPVATFNGSEGYSLDNTAPTATITAPVNANASFDMTVTFNEAVTNFDPLNLTVLGGAVDEGTWSTGAGTSFSGKVIATGNLVNIILPQGSAADAVGNGNAASNTVMVQYDDTAPVISEAVVIPPLTNDNTPTFTLTSNEAGTITYGSACLSASTDMVSGSLAITLNELADATYSNCTVQVTDALGNASNTVTLAAFTIDTVAPTLVNLFRDEGTPNPTDADTIGFSMGFSEAVNAFDADQFSVTGTTATGVVTGSGRFRDIRLSGGDLADLNGTVAVSLKSDAVISDLAGNAMTDVMPTGTNQNTVQIINDADAPILEFVSFQSSSALGNDKAVRGDTLRLFFRANEPLAAAPRVTILGEVVGINPVFSGEIGVSRVAAENSEFVGLLNVPIIDGRDETVTFTIDEFSDTAGNAGAPVSATTDGSSVQIDGVRPTGVTTANVTGPLLSSSPQSFTLTVTFSEPVTGFVGAENISANNVVLSNMVAETDRIYTFTATPSGIGDVYIELNSNGIADGFGNTLESPEPLQIEVVDDLAPAVAISTETNTFTQSGREERVISVQFSEFVVAPDKSTVSVVNGEALSLVALDELSLVALNGSDSTNREPRINVTSANYLLTVKPDGTGDVEVQIPAGITTDFTGNANVASQQLTLTMLDDVAPTVSITTSVDQFSQSNTTPFTVTYTISEDVNPVGDPIAAVQAGIANGVPSNFQIVVPNTVFSATVTPSGNADVTISLSAGAVVDGDDNPNIASETVTVALIDDIRPAVSLGAEIKTFTKSELEERDVTLVFSEAVVQPDFSSIGVEHGTATKLAAGAQLARAAGEEELIDVDGSLYTVTIQPDGEGDVTVSVPAGVTTDANGNENQASELLILTMTDDVAPTVAITVSTDTVKLSELAPFTATYTFSKDVTFVGDSLSSINDGLINATASDLNPATIGSVFTATITPDGLGDIEVALAAATTEDAAGNATEQADTVTVALIDDVAPSGQIAGMPESTNGETPIEITVIFDQPVAGLTIDDFSIVNGMVTDLSAIAAAAARSTASEEFNGFTTWRATLAPDGGGNLSVLIGANAVVDASGNGNPEDIGPVVALLDNSDPKLLSITRETEETTDADIVSWIFEFSEPITGFGADDVNLQGGNGQMEISVQAIGNAATSNQAKPVAASTAVSANPSASRLFRVNVSGGGIDEGNFTLTVELSETAAITDANGNDMETFEPTETDEGTTTVINDSEPPTVVISAPESATGPFDVTFQFSEPVTGFTASDVTIANATMSEPTANTEGTTQGVAQEAASSSVFAQFYIATVTPEEHGDVTIALAANAVLDEAGNTNVASEAVTVAFTDVSLVQARTGAVINNFIYRRAQSILATQPDLGGRLDDRGGLGMTEKFALRAEGDGDGLQIDFGGSLTRLMSGKALAYAGEGLAGGSTATTELSRFNVWASGSLTKSSIGGQVQDFGVIHLGADYRVNQAFLVGAMGQFDYAEEFDSTTGIGASGKGWLIGPYTVIRLHEGLTFDGRALWGRSSNSVTPFGTYTDDFDTERFLLKGQLTGEFDMSGWTISPKLSLAYLNETQEAYVNDANVPIAERTVEIGQLSFGPTISQTFSLENGVRVTPRFSLEGIWNFKDTGIADIDTGILDGGRGNDLRARVDVGLKTEFGIGATLDVSGFFQGIADNDNQIYGGTAKLNMPF